MKTIPLTQSQVALVDDSDFAELSKWKWHALWQPNTQSFYAVRKVRVAKNKEIAIRMHNQILPCADGMETDHRNHQTLDNQRSNLRIVSTSQNQQNKRMQSNNTSGYRGVGWHKNRGWRARIFLGNKQNHIGYFATAQAASLAYEAAAKRLFGEYKYPQPANQIGA